MTTGRKPSPIDPSQPILPGKSLGGVTLGQPLTTLELPLFDEFARVGGAGGWYSMMGMFQANYRLDVIEIGVNIRTGLVCQISALAGYSGKLIDQFYVGMSVEKAMALSPRTKYNEAECVLEIDGLPGVWMEIPIDDPPLSQVRLTSISRICVYDTSVVEIVTLDDQRVT